MAEDRCAQIVHHALADLIGEERLNHPEHAGRDRDRDDPARVERERPRVVPPDRLQHAFEQEGRDDAEAGRDDDQQQDSSEPDPVRAEESADTVQVRPTHLRVGGPLRRRF